MNSFALLPNRFKKVGWIFLVMVLIMLVLDTMFDLDSIDFTFQIFSVYSSNGFEEGEWFSVHSEDMAYTVVSCVFILGGLLIMFSKEKIEDEFIMSIRMNALMWAVLVHFVLLLISFVTVFGLNFLFVVVYNMYTLLLIFISRYYYLMFKNRNLFNEA